MGAVERQERRGPRVRGRLRGSPREDTVAESRCLLTGCRQPGGQAVGKGRAAAAGRPAAGSDGEKFIYPRGTKIGVWTSPPELVVASDMMFIDAAEGRVEDARLADRVNAWLPANLHNPAVDGR